LVGLIGNKWKTKNSLLLKFDFLSHLINAFNQYLFKTTRNNFTMRTALTRFARATATHTRHTSGLHLAGARGVATKIDGNAIASDIRKEIAETTKQLTEKHGKKPGLA
jgi:hypothetical protein